MDFLTSTLLSGILYDMLKCQLSLTADSLKNRLQEWVVDDAVAKTMERELARLQLSQDMSEKAIARKIDESQSLQALLGAIRPNSSTIVTQTHSGSGDNIAGNKITNHK